MFIYLLLHRVLYDHKFFFARITLAILPNKVVVNAAEVQENSGQRYEINLQS